MVTAVAVLLLFPLFVGTCVVGFFAGLYSFVLLIQLERQRIAPFGPAWAIWRMGMYAPSILTLKGQRLLPKWRRATIVFYVCLVTALLSASLAYLLSSKANPLWGTQTPNSSIERTVFGHCLPLQVHLAPADGGDILFGSCVRSALLSDSRSIPNTMLNPARFARWTPNRCALSL